MFNWWLHSLRNGSAATRLLEMRVRISPGSWMSFVDVGCFQVEVSTTGRSLVQRGPTECVCVHVSVIWWNNNTLHLKWVVKKEVQIRKKERTFNYCSIMQSLTTRSLFWCSRRSYLLSFLPIIMNGFFLDNIKFLWLFKIQILWDMTPNW